MEMPGFWDKPTESAGLMQKRRQIERTEALPPSRPLNELERALPSGPLQDLAAAGLDARYFSGRIDGLCPARAEELIVATL